MSERLKELAWNASARYSRVVGSNPTLSASGYGQALSAQTTTDIHIYVA